MSSQKSIIWFGLASAGILISAWYFQYVEGLAPCGLCLRQRIGHYIIIPVSLVAACFWAMAPKFRPITNIVALAIITIAASFSAYWAGFHIGVENQWWPGLATCGGSSTANMTFEQLMNTQFVPCDKPTLIFNWVFGGLSMAVIHFGILVLFVGLAGLSLVHSVLPIFNSRG